MKSGRADYCVMGYHRPTSNFNRGKKEEFASRKTFKEEKAMDEIEKRDMLKETLCEYEGGYSVIRED